MKSAIAEGIIAVANHKLRVEGIKSYKEFLAEEYYPKKDVLELIDDIDDEHLKYSLKDKRSQEFIEGWLGSLERLKKEIEGE